MFTTEYKQAGVRVMSQKLTQAVLAHYKTTSSTEELYCFLIAGK